MEVKIKPLQIADAYTSVKWRNDPEVFKYTGNTYEHEITLESELMWIQKAISNQNERRFAIIADGEYVGNIYLTDIQTNIGRGGSTTYLSGTKAIGAKGWHQQHRA